MEMWHITIKKIVVALTIHDTSTFEVMHVFNK